MFWLSCFDHIIMSIFINSPQRNYSTGHLFKHLKNHLLFCVLWQMSSCCYANKVALYNIWVWFNCLVCHFKVYIYILYSGNDDHNSRCLNNKWCTFTSCLTDGVSAVEKELIFTLSGLLRNRVSESLCYWGVCHYLSYILECMVLCSLMLGFIWG